MISIQYIRENPELIQNNLQKKNIQVDLDEILSLDEKRRSSLQTVEKLKADRNKTSQEISDKKKNGDDAKDVIQKMKRVSDEIKLIDGEIRTIDGQLKNQLLYLPNISHESVPIGDNENDNIIEREWGEKPTFDFDIHDHIHITEKLKLLDMPRSVKIAGSGFPLYTGKGAKLERALINFMLDYHVEHHGYIELFPPFLASHSAATTTGQLPKFKDDMYQIDQDELMCIPTAEVPVTNIHRDEILSENNLPINYTAYTACFRREAGSYGKDTRGLLRVHQFNKVEMVKFVKPETSYDELEKLILDAEAILKALGLHYRVLSLCTGDLSFSAAKCYDLEVWAPGENKYLEVSSCSNFESFQARRGNIRFRRNEDKKVEHVHTLNGSGVATPRLMVALLETFQQADGSIHLPEILCPYTGFKTISL